MDAYFFVQKDPVQRVDSIGSDIDLPVIFFGIEVCKLKEMDLDIVLLHHKVPFMVGIAEFHKAQLIYIIVFRDGFVTHG